uniref:PhoLip_ATPase_N domain-containing protein n=1 Tax=Globodera pallida TaxID=36090 RepID=A0A183BNC4_GLOPA
MAKILNKNLPSAITESNLRKFMRYSRLATTDGDESLDEHTPLMLGSEPNGQLNAADDTFLLPTLSPSALSFNSTAAAAHSSPVSRFLSMFRCCKSVLPRKRLLHSRTIRIGHGPVCTGGHTFPPNVICNRKYNMFTFVPMVLFQQFKFFLNLYFLLMAQTIRLPETNNTIIPNKSINRNPIIRLNGRTQQFG